MKVLFLDVDGVIVTAMTLQERSKMEKIVNKNCVRILNEIIEESEAKIVVSSSWRFCGLNEIRLLFNFWGIKGNIIGMTKDISSFSKSTNYDKAREEEIDEYLSAHSEIKKYVVVDDLKLTYTNFVKTQALMGITEIEKEKILKILNS